MKAHHDRPARLPLATALFFALFLTAAPAHAQGWGGGAANPDTTGAGGAPDVAEIIAESADDSDLRVVVRRFEQDRAVLTRRYDVPLSPVLIERQREFLQGWNNRLDDLDPSTLNAAGQEDYEALREDVEAGLAELEQQEETRDAMAELIPFSRPIQMLQERRRDRLDVEPKASAQTVEDARKEVLRLTETLQSEGSAAFPSITPELATSAREHVDDTQEVLDSWYEMYYGFDPLFTWWVQTPYAEFTEALEEYASALETAWDIEVEGEDEGNGN